MPVPAVIGAVVDFLQAQVNRSVFDGEIPRFDTTGAPISPQAPAQQFPVVRVMMDPGGTPRRRMFGGAGIDDSHVTLEVGGTERAATETLLDFIDRLLTNVNSWKMMDLQSPGSYVIHAKMLEWDDVQEEGKRAGQSGLIYRGSAKYEVRCYTKTQVQ